MKNILPLVLTVFLIFTYFGNFYKRFDGCSHEPPYASHAREVWEIYCK